MAQNRANEAVLGALWERICQKFRCMLIGRMRWNSEKNDVSKNGKLQMFVGDIHGITIYSVGNGVCSVWFPVKKIFDFQENFQKSQFRSALSLYVLLELCCF